MSRKGNWIPNLGHPKKWYKESKFGIGYIIYTLHFCPSIRHQHQLHHLSFQLRKNHPHLDLKAHHPHSPSLIESQTENNNSNCTADELTITGNWKMRIEDWKFSRHRGKIHDQGLDKTKQITIFAKYYIVLLCKKKYSYTASSIQLWWFNGNKISPSISNPKSHFGILRSILEFPKLPSIIKVSRLGYVLPVIVAL